MFVKDQDNQNNNQSQTSDSSDDQSTVQTDGFTKPADDQSQDRPRTISSADPSISEKDQTSQDDAQPPQEQKEAADYVNSYQPPATGQIDQPDQPADQPDQPADQPDQPDQPKEPEQFDHPDQPEQSDQPDQLGEQEKSDQPDQPHQPDQPDQLGEPEQSDQPDQPEDQPGQSEDQPKEPHQSNQQEKSDQPEEELNQPASLDQPLSDQPASAQSEESTQIKPPPPQHGQDQPPVSPPKQVRGSTYDEVRSEKLEDQNIFFLLGVKDGSAEEKEKFLDELQQVVWEDFLENDLKLLITSQEREKVDQILDSAELSDLDKQEKIIEYLETLIPITDLEQIMIEKALELKQDMVNERVEGMKEYHAGREETIAKIEEAAQQFSQGKWYTGAELLNELIE